MSIDWKALALAAAIAAAASVLHGLSALPAPWGALATGLLVMLAGAFPQYAKMGAKS